MRSNGTDLPDRVAAAANGLQWPRAPRPSPDCVCGRRGRVHGRGHARRWHGARDRPRSWVKRSDWTVNSFLSAFTGRRDRCCARLGVPLFDALAPHVDADRLWQSSHHGGHRFAANCSSFRRAFSWDESGRRMPRDVVSRLGTVVFRSTTIVAVRSTCRARRRLMQRCATRSRSMVLATFARSETTGRSLT